MVSVNDFLFLFQALVDGPCSGLSRKDINFKALHLTPITVKIGPSARTKSVKKAWEAAEVDKKWSETTWAKKLASREKVYLLYSEYECLYSFKV